MEEFKEVLKDAEKKYESKKTIYGESWKEMPLTELSRRLSEEYDEWCKAFEEKELYEESLDLINMSLMFAERLRKARKL